MPRKTKLLAPITVRRALRQLGSDLRDARRRRRIPMALMAERVGCTRVTLAKAERGDTAVSMGVYASMLFVLGMISRLQELASLRNDEMGIALENEQLPKRIHLKRRKLDS